MLSRYPGPWFARLRLRDNGWWGPLHQVGLRDTDAPSLPFLPVPINTSQLKGDNFNSDYLFHFHAKSFRYNRDYLERDFIIKTYHMVDDPNTDKWISWLDHGQSFVVRCQMEFSRDVLPRYMNMEGFSRFVFTLSAYGFVFRVRDYEHIEFAMAGFENREGHYWKKDFKHSLDLWPAGQVISSREKLREDPIQKLLPDTCFQEFMLKEGLLKVSAFRRRPHVPLFLVKTYVMVDDPASDNIVSWGHTGKSFVVWNAQKLYTDLLPAYFKHGDFAKFVLELCAFGFSFRSLKDSVQFEFAKRNFFRGQRQQPLQSPLQDLSSAALRIGKGVAEMGRMYQMDMRTQAPLQTPTNAGSKSCKHRLKPVKCSFKLRKCCGKPIQRRLETPLSQDSRIEDDITELQLLMKEVTKGIEKVLKRMKEKYRLRLPQTPASQESKAGHDIVELKEGVREVMKGMEEVMKGMEEMSLTRNMLLD